MSIIVFGSINKDLVATAPRLPLAGETLLGRDFFSVSGGKGANQAVAIARLGISTHIVGRVGAQSFGNELIVNLQAAGVETENVFVDETVNSGVAIIIVDDAGENQIIVIPGANGRVNLDDVERLSRLLPTAQSLLLQLEIPIPAVLAAAKAAQEKGVTVVLDPAPARSDIPEELLSLVNIITPNEVEAGQLVGFTVDGEESAHRAADLLLQKMTRGTNKSNNINLKCVLVKLGERGVYCATPDQRFFLPAFPVSAVDTTAAGDAFNAGFATALAEGKSLRKAVVWGAAAGALATTKPGAQPSLPDRFIFDKFLQEQVGDY